MHPIKMIALGLLALPLAEVAAFVVVASLIGFAAAFALLVLVSSVGVLVLRQVGSSAVTRLRTAAGNAEIAGVALDGADVGTALGGILLVVPGFITGVLGAMIVLPATRAWLMTALRRLLSYGGRQTGPRIIELAPDEWEVLPSPKLPPRRRRPKP